MAVPRWAKTLAAAFALLAAPVAAIEPRPFDYWILALSWSPQYCADKADRKEAQCGAQRHGFVVHGLWPQYERGYPQNCAKPARLPKRVIERLLPLMPSRKLIQHQWNKHGVCTGWPVENYASAIERAWIRTRIPEPYREVAVYLNTTAGELERQFVQANPGAQPEGIALECRKRYLREVRLCLNKDFYPRACGSEIRDRCGSDITLRPSK